jgi:hypothetical protein
VSEAVMLRCLDRRRLEITGYESESRNDSPETPHCGASGDGR